MTFNHAQSYKQLQKELFFDSVLVFASIMSFKFYDIFAAVYGLTFRAAVPIGDKVL